MVILHGLGDAMRYVCMLTRRMHLCIILIVLLVVLPSVGQARITTILEEWFEDQPIESWPWECFGQQWRVIPNSSGHVWGVEENTVFYPVDRGIRSMWCVGDPNDLQAGTDFYPPGVTTVASWGPFDLTNAVSCSGSHFLLADVESNAHGNGDEYLIITRTEQDFSNPALWDTVYTLSSEGTLGEWEDISFDLNCVRQHGTGDIISMLGEEQVYIGFAFVSDDDNNSGHGCFVDQITLGFDDGLYDYEAITLGVEDPIDASIEYEDLYVNNPVRIRAYFNSYGDLLSNEVTHYLLINGVVFDSVRAAHQGALLGNNYNVAFDRLYTPTEVGTVNFQVLLDAHDEQLESIEDNNSLEHEATYEVFSENRPPWIEFHRPTSDGVWMDGDQVEIVFTAYNTPETEQALVSFFFDSDQDHNHVNPIQGAGGIAVTGERDSFVWHNSNINDGEYYILAIMDDFHHQTRYWYSEGKVIISRLDVPDAGDLGEIPENFSLVSISPNPFNPTVDISFKIPVRSDVTATWFSIDGRQVERQVMKSLSAGAQRFSWTPHNLPSGVYLLNLQTVGASLQSKVVYMK